MPTIYVAYCSETGKTYVGQTVDFKRRRAVHLCAAFKGSNRIPKFYPAIRKYGWDKFIWSTIECKDEIQLSSLEEYWILKLDSIENGYNCELPLASQNYQRSAQSRRKVSLATLGRKDSLETKLKKSLSAKGKVFSQEHRKNLSIAKAGQTPFLGRNQSFEARKKISSWRLGRKRGPSGEWLPRPEEMVS